MGRRKRYESAENKGADTDADESATDGSADAYHEDPDGAVHADPDGATHGSKE